METAARNHLGCLAIKDWESRGFRNCHVPLQCRLTLLNHQYRRHILYLYRRETRLLEFDAPRPIRAVIILVVVITERPARVAFLPVAGKGRKNSHCVLNVVLLLLEVRVEVSFRPFLLLLLLKAGLPFLTSIIMLLSLNLLFLTRVPIRVVAALSAFVVVRGFLQPKQAPAVVGLEARLKAGHFTLH